MQTYHLKYEGQRQTALSVGVADARMAVDVLEARECPDKVELWKGDDLMCSLEPCGEGFWRVSR